MLDPRIAKSYSGIDLSYEESEALWGFIISGCRPPETAAPEEEAPAEREPVTREAEETEEPVPEEIPGPEATEDEAESAEAPAVEETEEAENKPEIELVFPESTLRFEDFLPPEEPKPEKPEDSDAQPEEDTAPAEPELTFEEEFAEEPFLSEPEPVRRPRASSRRSHAKRRATLRDLPKPPKPVLIAVAAVILVAVIVILLVVNGNGKASEEPFEDNGTDTAVTAGGENYSRSAVAIQQAEDLSETLSYDGPAWAMEKIGNAQKALEEWNTWKQEKKRAYFDETMPSLTEFLMRDGEFDGTDVTENEDGTYTLTHWSFGADTASNAIDPITGQVIGEITKVPDTGSAVTVSEGEFLCYQEYTEEQILSEGYGDYYYIYNVQDEEDAAKLEEIAAKYGLKLRKEEGSSGGFGEAEDSVLHRQLSDAVSKGDVYAREPEIDHYVYFSNASFQSVADLYLMDGRRMNTVLCSTHYDEMIDGRVVGGFTVSNPGTMDPRVYTAADGTQVSISQNNEQAVAYAYLENGYVILDMSVDHWRVRPADESDSMTISKLETDFSVTEDDVNYIIDAINFAKLK